MKKHTMTLLKMLSFLWFCLYCYTMNSFAQELPIDPIDLSGGTTDPPPSEEINCPPTDYITINTPNSTTIDIYWGAVTNAISYEVSISINGQTDTTIIVFAPSTNSTYYPTISLAAGDTITSCITTHCTQTIPSDGGIGKAQTYRVSHFCNSIPYLTSLATVTPVYLSGENGLIDICHQPPSNTYNNSQVSFNEFDFNDVCSNSFDDNETACIREVDYEIAYICNNCICKCVDECIDECTYGCISTYTGNSFNCECLKGCLLDYNDYQCPPQQNKIVSTSRNIYPNPVKNNCTLQYQLTTNSTVTLQIFTLSGIKLFDMQQTQTAGQQIWELNTSNIPTGLHYYLLHINGEIQQGKFLKVE